MSADEVLSVKCKNGRYLPYSSLQAGDFPPSCAWPAYHELYPAYPMPVLHELSSFVNGHAREGSVYHAHNSQRTSF